MNEWRILRQAQDNVNEGISNHKRSWGFNVAAARHPAAKLKRHVSLVCRSAAVLREVPNR